MPMIRSTTKPTDAVYDAWGNVIRGDWREVPGMTYEPGQAHLWDISGETHAAGEAPVAAGSPSLLAGYTGGQGLIAQALADPAFRAGTRSYAAGAPGVQSVNAYNAALRAQGIDPSELPYGQGGQIATARVQSQHGLPIADYLRPYLDSALAGLGGGGNGSGPLWDKVYSPGEEPPGYGAAAVAGARPTQPAGAAGPYTRGFSPNNQAEITGRNVQPQPPATHPIGLDFFRKKFRPQSRVTPITQSLYGSGGGGETQRILGLGGF